MNATANLESTMTHHLILGTAGHIDHGKTSLIAALTGVDTDRLPEERRRGITIDLGFASLQLGGCQLGVVDVPGHERFVRNMLAGATGVDVALLVVAADDSVKPQTREHFEILRLLHLHEGVIALTKADLVDPEWLLLVEEEVRELVQGTFLENAPVIPTSAPTGRGIEELREALSAAAQRAAARPQVKDAPFRMAIDRVFTMTGHGAVVTGSVTSGQAHVGDHLEIQPGAISVRVRGLQNHESSVEAVGRGQRAAVNLAGVRHDEIVRGQELATSGFLAPSRLLTVQANLLDSVSKPLKSRSRVRVHLGTGEFLASIVLLEGDSLAPGESALAQLFLSEPVVATWRQPLVLRSESPVVTIGGGRVVHPGAGKLRPRDEQALLHLERMQSEDETERADAAVFFSDLSFWQPEELHRTAGVSDPKGECQSLIEAGKLRSIQLSPTQSTLVHRQSFDDLCERIETSLRKLHEREPLRQTLERSQLMRRFDYLESPAIVNAAMEEMSRQKRVRLTADRVGLAGFGPKLSKNERRLLEELIQLHREAGLAPPTLKECKQHADRLSGTVEQLLALAAGEGDLVRISADFHLHADAEAELREKVAAAMGDGRGKTLSELREALQTTRKYAVPFFEHLDEIGFTKREGDLRVLASKP